MKADLASLDAARLERRHPAAGGSDRVAEALVAAGLGLTACGIVAATLWAVWWLAEGAP